MVLPRRKTYASHWNRIRTSRASDMLALLATGAAERPPRSEAQAGMVIVKRYWRLQVAITPAQALRQGRGEVSTWARKCFGAFFRCPGRSGVRPRGGPDEAEEAGPAHHGPRPDDEFTDYKAHLTRPVEEEVLVQADKDKSAAWRMPAHVYLHLVAHLLVADIVHWRRVNCSVHEVSALYHHLRREVLSRRFAYMASAHRWAGFGFNCMYMSLKAKCFTHLEGAPARSQDTAASARWSAGARTRLLTTTAGWPGAPRRSLPLGVGGMMSPPSRRRRPSCAARLQPSPARPLTASRGQRGRPLARSSVPGAVPTCPVPPWSSPTRPRCMRRSPKQNPERLAIFHHLGHRP